jgi:hypothetical protein
MIFVLFSMTLSVFETHKLIKSVKNYLVRSPSTHSLLFLLTFGIVSSAVKP